MRHRSDKPKPQLAGKSVAPSTVNAKQAAIQAKAERMAQRVRDHHAVGCEANTAQAEKRIGTTQFASMRGIDPGTLRRWKLFARRYSATALEELCRLHRRNGLPLHWGFVPYLLTIKNATKRRRMAAKAAANDWSPARLHSEVRRTEGRPPGHGRTVELPALPTDGLLHVVREGRLWLARAKMLITSLNFSNETPAKLRKADAEPGLNELAKFFMQVRTECARLGKGLEAARKSASTSQMTRRTGKRRTRRM